MADPEMVLFQAIRSQDSHAKVADFAGKPSDKVGSGVQASVLQYLVIIVKAHPGFCVCIRHTYLCRSCLTQVHLVNPLFYYPTLVGCRFLSTVGYLSTAFVCGTHNEPVDLHKSRLPVPTENGMIRRSRVYQQPVHSANLFLALRNNDDPASR